MEKVVLLNAAKETSAALGAAIEAVKTMQTPIAETWAEREQRLSEGRSSPTGWPIVRQDDGITIPTHPARRDSGGTRQFVESCIAQGYIEAFPASNKTFVFRSINWMMGERK